MVKMNLPTTLRSGHLLVSQSEKVSSILRLTPEVLCSTIKCPVCGGKKWEKYLQGEDFWLEKCQGCGLVKTNSQRRDKSGGVPDYKNGPRYAKELLDYINSSGSLLDVGAGKGEFLVKEARRRGFTAIGIDPLVNTDLEHFKTKKKFDVLVLKHVIEHVGDLNRFLSICRKLLKPGGTILISCPNIRSLMFFLFRQRWYGLASGQHVWQFSPGPMRKLLEAGGYKNIQINVINMDYQSPGIKGIIFRFLLAVAKNSGLGDQIVVTARS